MAGIFVLSDVFILLDFVIVFDMPAIVGLKYSASSMLVALVPFQHADFMFSTVLRSSYLVDLC